MKKEDLKIGGTYQLRDLTEDLYYMHINPIIEDKKLFAYRPRNHDDDDRYIFEMIDHEYFRLRSIGKKGTLIPR
jgi:hypothetical protein